MIAEFLARTSKRCEMLDITSRVEDCLKNVREATATVFVMHTTAGITINENSDPDVREDMLKRLSELVPESGGYKHSEGNSDAHIKASLMGSSVRVIVQNGKLSLGAWQGIFLCEFDGPRTRKIIIYC